MVSDITCFYALYRSAVYMPT